MLFCETIEISYDELKNFKLKEKSHKPFILCIKKENIKFEIALTKFSSKSMKNLKRNKKKNQKLR